MVASAAQAPAVNVPEGDGGCGLRDLCPQDKKKVAKLIRQVVDLQQELEVQRSRSQDHQDQTEQLKQLREKNKEVVKENAGLRSKLAHALAILRMYQHKVQLLDAAASHQQAPHPVAANPSQSASDGIQMQEAQSTAVQRSQAACDGQGSLPEAAVALSGAAGIPDEVLQRAGLSVNDSSGGSSGGVGHRSDQRSSPRQLQSSSLGSESLEEPNKGTQLPCAQVLEDCTVSQGVKYQRQAEANANKPAEGQKASDEPHAGSDCSSKHPSEAPTQLHKLRFDPTVGTCGAFFIMEDNESSAASEAGSDSEADASLAQLEAPSNQSQHPAAGRISLPSHNSSRELAEQPREVLPLPTASRPETGRSSQQSLAEDAGVSLSQRGSSPRQTERSSSSSAGLTSRQFGGSLIDLVAEVEQLIGQGSSTHHDRSYYSTGGSCAHSDIASDGPSHDEAARALQERYCQQWIGNLVRSQGHSIGRLTHVTAHSTANPQSSAKYIN